MKNLKQLLMRKKSLSKMKESIRNTKSKDQLNENNRDIRENSENVQLNRLKNAVKNKEGTTLRMNVRMFNRNNLPHELLLITRQTTKLRNEIESNMSIDIKLPKYQISKIMQSGEFLGSLLSKLAGPLTKVVLHWHKMF